MGKQISVVQGEDGNYKLLGPDGYSTTEKKWKKKEEAEKARDREQKLEDSGKPSKLRWAY